MNKLLIPVLITLIGILLTIGCSNSDNPIETPQNPVEISNQVTNQLSNSDQSQNGHYLWSYNFIYVDQTDPDEISFEVVPVKQPVGHYNILNWLEKSPCADCFKLKSLAPSGNGTLLAEIEIKHPFGNPNLTGFDVRGIPMFNGSGYFPEAGLDYSERTLGDGALVNPDGYTTLYNGSTIGEGPMGLQGYIDGKLATMSVPDSHLNGYIRHSSDGLSNTRNCFFAGDTVSKTYEIDMPDSQFVFGYAVDASWAKAETLPVTDPIADFGVNANCSEPWKIEVTELSNNLTTDGGYATLQIDVYDYQGWDTNYLPVVECPEIFTGTLTAQETAVYSDYASCEITIENTLAITGGEYSCLISVQDGDNDPDNSPWLDLTAYQIVSLEVTEIPPAAWDITPPYLNYAPLDIAISGNYAFTASGYFGFHVIDKTDPGIPVWATKLDMPGFANRICVDGSIAYVACKNAGLVMIDISDPENPIILKTIDISGSALTINVRDGYAFVGTDNKTVEIIDVDPLESATVISSVTTPDIPNDLDLSGDYLFVGLQWGHFCSISINPIESPSVVQTLDAIVYGRGVEVVGDYALVADYPAALKVVNISNPAAMSVVKSVQFTDGAIDCVVNSDYAYVACGDRVIVINVVSPSSPTYMGEKELKGWAQNLVYENNRVYIANPDVGMQGVWVGNPELPGIESVVDTAGSAYTCIVDGEYSYVPNWNGGLAIMDSWPAEETRIIKIVDEGLRYVRDVALDGGYAYMAGNAGVVWVVDVDPISSADVVDGINLSNGSLQSIVTGDGFAYGAHSGSGLNIFDISTPGTIDLKVEYATVNTARDVAYADGYAYVACSAGGIEIVDVDPYQTTDGVMLIPTLGECNGVCVDGNYLYATVSDTGLLIVNISNPELPEIIKTVNFTGWPSDVTVANGKAYVALGHPGFKIIDVSDPANAYTIETINPNLPIGSVEVQDDKLYMTGVGPGESGLLIYQLQ